MQRPFAYGFSSWATETSANSFFNGEPSEKIANLLKQIPEAEVLTRYDYTINPDDPVIQHVAFKIFPSHQVLCLLPTIS